MVQVRALEKGFFSQKNLVANCVCSQEDIDSLIIASSNLDLSGCQGLGHRKHLGTVSWL